VDFAQNQAKPKLWESEPGDVVEKFLGEVVGAGRTAGAANTKSH
jgi:hypothetical protein